MSKSLWSVGLIGCVAALTLGLAAILGPTKRVAAAAGAQLGSTGAAGAEAFVDGLPAVDAPVEGAPADGEVASTPGSASAAVPQSTPGAAGGAAARLDALALRFDDGLRAWRRGERELARVQWEALLAELPPVPRPHQQPERRFDRGTLLYALGNAAFRADEPLEALAWYRAAQRYWPRDPDLRHNLALSAERADVRAVPARSGAGWLLALARAVTPGEARWLALLGLLPLAVALLHEALGGGRGARALAAVAATLALLMAAPLLIENFVPRAPQSMVIDPEGVALRSEPGSDAARIGRLEPGAVTDRIDRLPDWVRVGRSADERGWVAADAVFELQR